MTGIADGHVQQSLGLYVLGALDADGVASVHEHLAGCARCRAESDDLGVVPAALALLSGDDVTALVREFGAPVATRARRPWRPRPLRVAVAAGLVALVIGLGIGWVITADRAAPTGTTLTGATTDSTTGATMSVVVSRRADGATVRATVAGLRPDVRYQLFVVTLDGQRLPVRQWLGTTTAQTITADLPVPVAELVRVTVAELDGAVVVSVRVGSVTRPPVTPASASPRAGP